MYSNETEVLATAHASSGLPLLECHDVSKQFFLRLPQFDNERRLKDELGIRMRQWLKLQGDIPTNEFWACRHLSFSMNKGERIALLGPNGAGKSCLLKLISRIYTVTSGHIISRGQTYSILGNRAGVVTHLTGRENIILQAALRGLSPDQAEAVMDEIITFSGLNQFIDVPVKRYSFGMGIRLTLACALFLPCDLLIIDEAVLGGDSHFNAMCLERYLWLHEHQQTSLLMVSHDMKLIEEHCTRGLVMMNGQLDFDGSTVDAIARYKHLSATNEIGA